MDIQQLVRPCIRTLKPYSSARDEYKGEASVFLDANENPLSERYNRYPDPMQWEVKEKIARLKGVSARQILLGNGSDEPIDLLYRAFCEPKQDNVVAIDPTYGMYQVCAEVNDIEYRSMKLSAEYELDAEKLRRTTDRNTKIVWLCSPNNPTGNSLPIDKIEYILHKFNGIVVVDEAYIDFSSQPSWLSRLSEFSNLVVLQTFSKAWGSAAVRLGMAFASEEIIRVLSKIKYPYNINQLTQEYALTLLDRADEVKGWVEEIIRERARLVQELSTLEDVKRIYPSDANFLLVKMIDANKVYNALVERGIIVRNRHKVTLCENSLRITIGTAQENDQLLKVLREVI